MWKCVWTREWYESEVVSHFAETTNQTNCFWLDLIKAVFEGEKVQHRPPQRERAPETCSSLPWASTLEISVVHLRPGVMIRMEAADTTHIPTSATLITNKSAVGERDKKNVYITGHSLIGWSVCTSPQSHSIKQFLMFFSIKACQRTYLQTSVWWVLCIVTSAHVLSPLK